jgi:hypothetical protein
MLLRRKRQAQEFKCVCKSPSCGADGSNVVPGADSHNQLPLALIVGSAAGGGCLLMLLIAGACLAWRSRTRKAARARPAATPEPQEIPLDKLSPVPPTQEYGQIGNVGGGAAPTGEYAGAPALSHYQRAPLSASLSHYAQPDSTLEF